VRARDIALELPPSPLEAVMSGEVWEEVYDRLVQLIDMHRTTLVFVNTRRLAERAAHHLSERIGKENVTSHHGSLSKEQRLNAEQRLKSGKLRALVATASLELGIDIGDVDLVCQLGSPRSIATFLQRVGRANHAVGGVPKGRLFPTSRDELVECTALLDAVRRGELDHLIIPDKPLDVLAQQIVAEVAAHERYEDELFELVRRAYPYRALTRAEFDAVVKMLSEGLSTRRGRQSAYLHRDAVNRRLRARRGARLTALTNGGAIPDNADFQVILEPAEIMIGTVNEDFAVESMPGDIFQLGNHSYLIRRIEAGRVRVEDAEGAPPSIPFWLGEAPGRTEELSAAVSRLRADIDTRLGHVSQASIEATIEWLRTEQSLSEAAARQLTEYLAGAKGVLGVLPTQEKIVFERFFDESGGMQFIIHAPFGSRINKAWGLALRKRFCRKFNFELQAAATEDAIVLSLGETHSFALEEVKNYLNSRSVRDVLVQALLTAPVFNVRWRWVASIALAIQRFRNGGKRPAALQRMDAEDLVAIVFPDQIACAENLQGDREVPDHPLATQTIHDCLHEAMDIDGLVNVIAALERGEKQVIGRDLPHPSPLAQEILNAKPYAFLDDAPLEERRTRAVASRRWLDPAEAADFGRLDPEAIARVREEAWPEATNPDELHDALLLLGFITDAEGTRSGWRNLFERLIETKRATHLVATGQATLWVAAEQLPTVRAVLPQAGVQPALEVPKEFAERAWAREEALTEIVRARLQGLGPVTAANLAKPVAVNTTEIDAALLALEAEGFAMRGNFSGEAALEWCERRLLARIHRYTVQRLRAEIEPVSVADFLRFLFDWQGLTTDPRPEGPQALAAVIEQLEGFEAPAAAWEADLLAARLHDYDPQYLDGLCLAGRALWTRLTPPKPQPRHPGRAALGSVQSPKVADGKEHASQPVRTTPIALLTRSRLTLWHALATGREVVALRLAPRAQAVVEYLKQHGASFFDEIATGTGLLKTQTEEALGELVGAGLVNSDSFAGLRALLLPADRKGGFADRTEARAARQGRRGGGLAGHRRRRMPLMSIEEAGRWTLRMRANAADAAHSSPELVEAVARVLLRRYGVVFRRLLEREADWLPPWYELLRVYRRLEARGEIRGGRFVNGVAGEQYALPEAVGSLRAMRKKPADETLVSITAADPLNLVGVLTPGARVPALAGNRVLFRDGVPIAVQVAGEAQFLTELDPAAAWQAHNALLRKPAAAATKPSLN
jgi:ATP-dependent Lhr-like helicase